MSKGCFGKKGAAEVVALMGLVGDDAVRLEVLWRRSELKLPASALGVCGNGQCQGVKVCGGLYLQCKLKATSGDYCKVCVGSFISDGRPKHGIITERLSLENWTTDEGKSGITWMQYLKKNGYTREEGEEVASDRGVTILDREWLMPSRKGRRGCGASDTSSEGGRVSHTTRYLPLDSYSGVSPSNVDSAHKGKDGVPLRVKKYQDGRVVKSNPKNWTDEANAKFVKMYGDEGFEEKKISRKKKKQHANDDAIAAMQAELEKLRAQVAEKNEDAGEEKKDAGDEEKEADEKKKKAEKKARAKAERLAKKKAAAEMKKKEQEKAVAALKAKQEAEKAKQEAEMAALMQNDKELEEDLSGSESEFDSGSDDDDDEEEVDFNAFDHDGMTYHKDVDGKLYTAEQEEVGYVNEDGEVIMY